MWWRRSDNLPDRSFACSGARFSVSFAGPTPLASPEMLATVDPLLPLSLLEAVRTVDRPSDLAETEFVDELRNKRFGLSDTVYVQIKRYTEAVRKNQRTAQDEAVALARLIGRRPDAEEVFRAAGRFVARESYRTVSGGRRTFMRVMPTLLARPMALGSMRKLGRRYFTGNVRRVGSSLLLEVPRSVTVSAAPGGLGCVYYESALGELLRLLIGSVGAVEHVHCNGRGEGTCEWRADWSSIDRSALDRD